MTALTISGITYSVEVAFTTDPLAVPGTWTDISDYVRGVSTRRGRNHELGRMQAGEIMVRLDNRDRRFDPTYTSGPYYPNVIPMRHFRVRATYGSTYPGFYGFVEDWGQTWPEPAANAQGDAEIELHAVDGFKVLSLRQLRAYRAAVLADSPLIYWPLDGHDWPTEVDLGSAGAPPQFPVIFNGTGTADAAQGVPGGAVGPFDAETGAPALDCPNTGQSFMCTGNYQLPSSVSVDTGETTLEMWVRPDGSGPMADLFKITDATTNGVTGFGLDVTTLRPRFWYVTDTGTTGPFNFSGAASLSAAVWHHLALVLTMDAATFYVDGVNVGTVSPLLRPTRSIGTELRIGRGTYDFAAAHVAVYETALTDAQVAAHYAANTDLIAEASGAAIGHILNAAGWPAGLRALDNGASTVTLTPSGSALDALQQIAEDTEHGLLMAAGDNTLTFLDRDTVQGRLSASATFGDGAGEVRYHDLQLSYDDQDLWTEVDVSDADGSHVVVSDATAATKYGTRTLDATTIAATANEVADQANGLLNRYKAPAVRPVSMVLFGTAAITQQLSRLIGDRVTVKRRPPGGGTISVDAIIEGVNHDANDGSGWVKTTLALAPPEPQPFWILGDATYGVEDSTTRLGW